MYFVEFRKAGRVIYTKKVLFHRLEHPEERMLPAAEPAILEMILVDSDGTRKLAASGLKCHGCSSVSARANRAFRSWV
jgi:hypothetical protein